MKVLIERWKKKKRQATLYGFDTKQLKDAISNFSRLLN